VEPSEALIEADARLSILQQGRHARQIDSLDLEEQNGQPEQNRLAIERAMAEVRGGDGCEVRKSALLQDLELVAEKLSERHPRIVDGMESYQRFAEPARCLERLGLTLAAKRSTQRFNARFTSKPDSGST
jgi:hypothetical protein